MADPQSIFHVGFTKLMGVRYTSISATHAEGEITITPDLLQPNGFLHGGVTLALLETIGSAAAWANSNHETQMGFGVGMNVRHKKPGVAGVVRATADLEHQEVSSYSGALKQTWRVVAYDEAGDVMSEGTFDTKIVSREYFARKNAEHASGNR